MKNLTKKDVVDVLRLFKITFPYYFEKLSKEDMNAMITLYQMHFKNYDADIFKQIAFEITGKYNFMPSIPNIKEEYIKKTTPEEPSGEEMWNFVMQLVKEYGFYREEEAYREMNGKTEYAVRSIGGFAKICQSSTSDNNWNKKDFIEIYNRQLQKEKEVALIGSSVFMIGEKNGNMVANSKL